MNQSGDNSSQITFPVASILDGTLTDFDLYLEIQGRRVLYATPGYRWTRDETARLLSSGWNQFTVDASQADRIKMYLDLARIPLIEKEQAPQIRIQSIHDIAGSFTRCLYDGEVTPAAIDYGEKVAASMVQCLLEAPDAIKGISGLVDHDSYTYFHSARVAVFSTAIAIAMGIKDEPHLQRIAMGGLFHDIGKKDVPLDVLNKPGALTPEEWSLMKSHPVVGHDILKDSGLSMETLEIILHHHERINGSGYPHGLDQSAIMVEVQIAAVADIYDALTSSRSYQRRRTRYEALDFIKHKLLASDISPAAFRGLVAALV